MTTNQSRRSTRTATTQRISQQSGPVVSMTTLCSWLLIMSVLLLLSGSPAQGFSTRPTPPTTQRSNKKNMKKNHKERFLFSMELLAPPLAPLDSDVASSLLQPVALPITYTNDPRVVEAWLATHVWSQIERSPQDCLTLGVDTEAIPQFRGRHSHDALKNVAVVQLATSTSALVVQLAQRSGRPSRACHQVLREVFEHSQIIKAGCAVEDDFLDLQKLWNTQQGHHLQAPNRLDLGRLFVAESTSSHQPHLQTGLVGLKTVTAAVLGLDLKKSKRLAISNWGQVPLAMNQVLYAARDAWAAAAVVETLAKADPNRFGSVALRDVLQNDAPLHHVQERTQKRQETKHAMRRIRKACQSGKMEPSDARHFLNQLQQVLQAHSHVLPPPIQLTTTNKPTNGRTATLAALTFHNHTDGFSCP